MLSYFNVICVIKFCFNVLNANGGNLLQYQPIGHFLQRNTNVSVELLQKHVQSYRRAAACRRVNNNAATVKQMTLVQKVFVLACLPCLHDDLGTDSSAMQTVTAARKPTLQQLYRRTEATCCGQKKYNLETGRKHKSVVPSHDHTHECSRAVDLVLELPRCWGGVESPQLIGGTPTQTHNRFTALWILSGTTRVSRYQKKHSPTHTYRGHQSQIVGKFCPSLKSIRWD